MENTAIGAQQFDTACRGERYSPRRADYREFARAKIPDSQELEDMRSDPSSSYLLAVFAFFVGIAVGWLLATVRVKGGINASLAPRWTSTAAQRLVTVNTHKLEIKCVCGSLMKFRDPVTPGYQPYPIGESVTCPNCGRTNDLTKIRKLEGDAQATTLTDDVR